MATSLNCPACSKQLTPQNWKNNIELDICEHCHGIWFDIGEMILVSDSDSLENIDNAFVGKYQEVNNEELLTQIKSPGRLCPKDNSQLERHQYEGGATIVLDYCPQCKGTWMDAGELEGYVASQKGFAIPESSAETKATIETEKKEYDDMIWDIKEGLAKRSIAGDQPQEKVVDFLMDGIWNINLLIEKKVKRRK